MIKNKQLLYIRSFLGKRLFLLLPLLLILGGLLFVTDKLVTAQNSGQGLEISPPSQEVTVDPGGTATVTAKVRNRGNSALPIEVHIEDFTAKGEEGQVELRSDSPYSIVSWTSVSPTSFELAPGEQQEVTATITAPTDAAGGHFGSFVFQVKPKNEDGGSSAALSQAVASLFLVRVSGPVNEKLTLKEFTAPGFSEFGPVPFALNFENSGNVHVKVFGLVNVKDMFGNKIEDIVVSGTNIFPGSSRILRPSLNKQFLIGPYTATAIMYYGSENENITQTTTFFVFPVRIAVGIAVILLVLYLMRKRLRKSLKALFK